MLFIIGSFLFCSSPLEESPGPESRSSSIPSETCKTDQTLEQQLESLCNRYLSLISYSKKSKIDWSTSNGIAVLEISGFSKENCQIQIVNALIKRIRHFYKKSRTFLDLERERKILNGITGPTPEMLKIAIDVYVPQKHQALYNTFLEENFLNLDEEKLIFLTTCTDVYEWLKDMEKEQKKPVEVKRAVHPRPWRF